MKPDPSILSAVIAGSRHVELKWMMRDGQWLKVMCEIIPGPNGRYDRPLSALTAGIDMNAKPGATTK